MEFPPKRARLNSKGEGIIFNLGAKRGAYAWLPDDYIVSSTKARILFEANATEDIHVSFNKTRGLTIGQVREYEN